MTPQLESFQNLQQRAAERKGGNKAIAALLADLDNEPCIASLSDDRVLSAFTKKVFQSGFVWRVVENKWSNFEECFFEFNLEKVLMMPEEMLARKASDAKIIRNYNKVKTIPANAQMMFEQQQNGHSFSEFLANWPNDDIIGLWAYLKKNGQRLGGNTGPYALRTMGKDTFLLTRDTEAYFRAHNIIDGGIQSKKSLMAIQQSFNEWRQQSGYSLAKLSRLVAYGTGDNYIGMATSE